MTNAYKDTTNDCPEIKQGHQSFMINLIIKVNHEIQKDQ